MIYALRFLKLNKLLDTWMCSNRGDGELESVYQGRSRDSSFSQETDAGVMCWPRIGFVPCLLEKAQDARLFLTHLPFFFLLAFAGTAMGTPLQIQKNLPLYKKQEPGLTTEQEKKLRQAAAMYEKHFLAEMVKAMRGTVQRSKLNTPSMAQKIYENKMDQQYVEKWGDIGGVGLGELIYQQLKDRYYPKRGPLRNPNAPIPTENHRMHKVEDQTPQQKKLQVQPPVGQSLAPRHSMGVVWSSYGPETWKVTENG